MGIKNHGDINFSCLYDTEETEGRRAIEDACEASRIFEPGDLRVYLSDYHYLTVATGGRMFVTKSKNIRTEKFDVGRLDFTVKIARRGLTILGG